MMDTVDEMMARMFGLTGTLRWGIRATAVETLIPAVAPASMARGLGQGGIVGIASTAASLPIHKWKAMNACKALATHQAGAGQGELQAAEASLRVPLRIICTPLFNWLVR